MENKIGKDFENLAQRVVYGYAGTMPGFVPVKSNLATEQSQKQLHGFISDMAQILYSNPETIGLPIRPDDYYNDWELQNCKPDLIDAMRNIKKKIDDFYMLLLKIGESGVIKNNMIYIDKTDLKFTNKTLSKLGHFGLKSEVQKEDTLFWSDEYPDMLPAWKLLSSVALENNKFPLLMFSHCMLDPTYPYSRDIFARLIENKSVLNSLEEFFEKSGYKYIDIRENEISMDWAKSYGKKDEPLKDSWAEREHGGLSVFYDYKKKNQITYGLRVPKFKELLSCFNDMDDNLKEFVIKTSKKCDNCGYCTQTDKTGTRKKQLANVTHNGNYNLCLLFPGFCYRWTSLDVNKVSDITMFLSFANKVLNEEAKQ